MASTGTSKEPATASHAQPVQRGWGGGGKNGGRRPTCLPGCWPDGGTAAKEEAVLAERGHGVSVWRGFGRHGLRRLGHKAQPCAVHPAMPVSGGADIM
ncbi:hypothetical protein [Xenorhabdus bovienii]|uniref:hypothetical protein n=1 Tax=Xenorhabdus bovienii TaxID=40576 RepID=UPI0021585F08|nr:hypothetical protein [Xenorhabdus bovienii]